MAGHSKWSNIKHKKGAADAARGKIFQKLAKEIYVAAKSGSPDVLENASLRLVVEKAKAANMPKDNIAKAIDKAKGNTSGENYEAIRYEGYGHGGVAFIVDCLTDNKNRTAALVRSAFTKSGGNLGTSGSVGYMFERKGIIVISNDLDEEEVMMTAIDNGALDFESGDDVYTITTTTEDFIKIKEALEQLGITEFLMSEITLVPNMTTTLDEEGKEKVEKLRSLLDDLDDVQDVFHNLDEN